MAIRLIANYAKRLGLPAYSSHQFSVSVETELTNVDDVAEESQRLYELLQSSVDAQIQDPGFVPGDGSAPSNGNGQSHNGSAAAWQCSEKQWTFLQGILTNHRLAEKDVDELAQKRFGCGIRRLNRLQMSGLLDELLERYGDSNKAYRQHRQNGGSRRQYSPARSSR